MDMRRIVFRYTDDSTGYPYFYDTSTNTSYWELPEGKYLCLTLPILL